MLDEFTWQGAGTVLGLGAIAGWASMRSAKFLLTPLFEHPYTEGDQLDDFPWLEAVIKNSEHAGETESDRTIHTFPLVQNSSVEKLQILLADRGYTRPRSRDQQSIQEGK